MSGGECKVKEPPPHVILGRTQVDQDWIDGEVEVGVTVCGFPRPRPRPEALDAPVTRQVALPPPPPAPRRGVLKRLKDRFRGASAQSPAVPVSPLRPQPPIVQVPPIVAVPTPAPPAPPAPPPPPPQDPVDALLHPRR